MRKATRRWLWLLVPLLGIGATLALPPVDEYAPFERIGTRFDAYDPYENGSTVLLSGDTPWARAERTRVKRLREREAHEADEKEGVARRRGWKIHVPEAEARRTVGSLFSSRRRWRDAGRGSSSTDFGKSRTIGYSKGYQNDETGDQAWITFEKRISPTGRATSIRVVVSQSQASLQPWALARRWARRIVGR